MRRGAVRFGGGVIGGRGSGFIVNMQEGGITEKRVPPKSQAPEQQIGVGVNLPLSFFSHPHSHVLLNG
jgi:hypothetical protein